MQEDQIFIRDTILKYLLWFFNVEIAVVDGGDLPGRSYTFAIEHTANISTVVFSNVYFARIAIVTIVCIEI